MPVQSDARTKRQIGTTAEFPAKNAAATGAAIWVHRLAVSPATPGRSTVWSKCGTIGRRLFERTSEPFHLSTPSGLTSRTRWQRSAIRNSRGIQIL